MASGKIRVTIAGLCAFVAKDWKKSNVGKADLLLINAGKSRYRTPGRKEKLCHHEPLLLFPEFEFKTAYLQALNLADGCENPLMSVSSRASARNINGILPLQKRSLSFFFVSLPNHVPLSDSAPLTIGPSFDHVLNMAAVSDQEKNPVARKWARSNRVGGIVGSRVLLDLGELSTDDLDDLDPYYFYAEGETDPAKAKEATVVQNVYWDLEIPMEGTPINLAIEVSRRSFFGASKREATLYFSVGEGSEKVPRPNFTISNLCGYEGGETEIGRDIAAYYDLLVKSIENRKRSVMHKELPDLETDKPDGQLEGEEVEKEAKSGAGFCPPVRLTSE